MMEEVLFAVRSSLVSGEVAYRLSGDALIWSSGAGEGRVALADITSLRVFLAPRVTLPLMGGAELSPGFIQCVVSRRGGRPIVLTSNHFLGLGRFENREPALETFVRALALRTAAANPDARFVRGASGVVWGLWLGVLLICLLGGLLAVLVVAESLRTGGGGRLITAVVGLVFLLCCGISGRSAWRMLRQSAAVRTAAEDLI